MKDECDSYFIDCSKI